MIKSAKHLTWHLTWTYRKTGMKAHSRFWKLCLKRMLHDNDIPSSDSTEMEIEEPSEPKQSQINRQRQSASVKKKLTYKCSRVTVRVIKLIISLWMVADMITDAFNTKRYLFLARVSWKCVIAIQCEM